MANDYYNFTGGPFVPGTKARSDQVNTEYQAIVTAFAKLPLEASSTHRGTGSYAGITGGSGNAYTVAMPNTRTTNQDGDEVVFQADRANTGAVTLNVDGIGAVSLVGPDGSTLSANDILLDSVYACRYDDTNTRFLLMRQVDSFSTGAAASAAAAAASASAALTSEGNAATSETNADSSATEAYHWAQYAEDSLVPEGDLSTEYSAYHWAQKAAASTAALSLPNPITANQFLRGDSGGTAWEQFDLFGTSNDWTYLQTISGGVQVYGDLAGSLYSGPGVEIEYITGSDVGAIRSYDRNTAADKDLTYSASLHDFYVGGSRVATLHDTAFVHSGSSTSTIVAGATTGNSPSFEQWENSSRRSQWYYDATANLTVWRQYLTDGSTVSAQMYFNDSGDVTFNDVVNTKTYTMTGGELQATGGDYFTREDRANTFSAIQTFTDGNMSAKFWDNSGAELLLSDSSSAVRCILNAAASNNVNIQLKENSGFVGLLYHDGTTADLILRKYSQSGGSALGEISLDDSGGINLTPYTGYDVDVASGNLTYSSGSYIYQPRTGQIVYNSDHTVSASDCLGLLWHSSGATHAWTLPSDSTDPDIPIGFWVDLAVAAGTINVTADSGVSLQRCGGGTYGTSSPYALTAGYRCRAYKKGANNWLLLTA